MEYEIGITETTYRMRVFGDFDKAYKVLQAQFRNIAASALALGKHEAEIFWDNCTEPLRILASMANAEDAEMLYRQLNPDATFKQVSDFLAQKQDDGLIVCVTSMIDDTCLLVNEVQHKGCVLQPWEWIGTNFKKYWRNSMEDYDRLMELLRRDKFVPDYQYRMIPVNGGMAAYESTFSLVEDFLGTPVRIRVAKVNSMQILQMARERS